MKIIELDLNGCKYLYDVHERIRIAFGFDDEYGHNWDAFWDMLWSECDADRVIIKGVRSLPAELKNSLGKLYEVLEDNLVFRQENRLASFSYQIVD